MVPDVSKTGFRAFYPAVEAREALALPYRGDSRSLDPLSQPPESMESRLSDERFRLREPIAEETDLIPFLKIQDLPFPVQLEADRTQISRYFAQVVVYLHFVVRKDHEIVDVPHIAWGFELLLNEMIEFQQIVICEILARYPSELQAFPLASDNRFIELYEILIAYPFPQHGEQPGLVYAVVEFLDVHLQAVLVPHDVLLDVPFAVGDPSSLEIAHAPSVDGSHDDFLQNLAKHRIVNLIWVKRVDGYQPFLSVFQYPSSSRPFVRYGPRRHVRVYRIDIAV